MYPFLPLRARTAMSCLCLFILTVSDAKTLAAGGNCSITIVSAVAGPESCPGEDDGTVSVDANCTICADDLEYSLDGIDFQDGGTFTGLAAGDYTVIVQEAGGKSCFEEVALTVGAGVDEVAPVPADTSIQWELAAQLLMSDAQASDEAGYSIEQSENFAIVGARYEDTGGTNAGAAYIFERTASGWVERTKLMASDAQRDDHFGFSLAISDDYAVVGAVGEDAGGSSAGAAYVFKREGATWTEVAKLVASDAQASDFFGFSLAISGNTILVGAYGEDTQNLNSGAAYIFELDGTDWVEHTKLMAPNGGYIDNFGYSVALSEEFAIVAANRQEVGFASNVGAVHVFRQSETDWVHTTELQPPAGSANDNFGTSIDLSGDYLIVGAPYERLGADNNVGAAYIFEHTATEWVLQARLAAADATGGDTFGSRVAISGSTALVGAPFKNADFNTAGAAYIFVRSDGGWTQRSKLTSPNARNNGLFGHEVSLLEDHAIVGAYQEGAGGISRAGGVHSFEPATFITTDTLAYCGTAVTATPPTASDDCAGTVTGTTSDVVTFNGPGTYTIAWTFDDNNGHVTEIEQVIEVVDRRVSITSVEAREPSCFGGDDGSIILRANCVDCPGSLEYSADGINYQQSNTLMGLTPGTYTVYARGAGQVYCTSSYAVTVGAGLDVTAPVPVTGTYGWEQAAKILVSDSQLSGQAGYAVALSDNYAIVGMPYQDLGVNESAGAAYIFQQTATGWVERVKLVSTNVTFEGFFGYSVAISDDFAVVGAPDEDETSNGAGAVYVFERTGTEWNLQTRLIAADATPADHLGTSVSISGSRVLAGAQYEDTGGNGAGAAYIFNYDGSAWTQEAKLTAPFRNTNDNFGRAVVISGDYAIVGMPGEDISGITNAGAAHVFEYTGAAWQHTAELLAGIPQGNGQFGTAVALHGTTALIGAPWESAGEVSAGAAYIFESTTSGWVQGSRLTASDRQANDRFGFSVAIRGDLVIVGAPYEDTDGNGAGTVYSYARKHSGWLETARFTGTDTNDGDNFGTSVAISSNFSMVGAPINEENGPYSGAAYLFSDEITLPADTLLLCGDAVAAATPTATDNCGGPVTTTTDSTTFDAPGTYRIVWAFDDGNGNTSSAKQTITVQTPNFSLPITETVETDSPTRDCWTTTNGQWGPRIDLSLANAGSAFFYLSPSDVANGLEEVLYSPSFTAEAGVEYLLSFSYRHNYPEGSTNLRAMLVDASGNGELKQLFSDKAASLTYERVHLRYEVPTDGSYRIAFESLSNMLGNGLMLDDITIAVFTSPADGAAALVGTADNSCTVLNSYGLDGEAWTRFLDPGGKLALEIYPNGNDLGDVLVEMTDYGAPPLAPFLGNPLLSRYFNITPENGSGPYTTNGGVKLRMYFLDQELNDFIDLRNRSVDWGSLVVTHYDGVDTDCQLGNSLTDAFDLLLPSRTADFGATAQFLEVTAQEFSEFGATSATAAPVVLTTFTARRSGKVNLLEWTVESEIDFSHYSVERSADGILFHELAQVKGANEPRYSITDPAPAALQYYRLKMLDYDGSFAYSKIIRVINASGKADRVLEAYPVPTSGAATIRFSSTAGQAVTAHITDALGRLVHRKLLIARGATDEFTVNLASLPPATYQLTLLDGRESRTIRLVKN